MTCEQVFANELRLRGYRLTSQREAVLLALHEIAHPTSADEIFSLVAQKNVDVELTTVYRTLDLLNSIGLVAIIDSGDKQRLYELAAANHPHLHLVCNGCGRITGVDLDQFQPVIDRIKQLAHFSADLGSITVQGTCTDCAELPPGEHIH